MSKNFNSSKAFQLNQLKAAPGLQNLVKIEDEINRFSPALLTIFEEVNKKWNKNQHLIVKHPKYGNIPMYVTTNYNQVYNKSLCGNNDKYNHQFSKSTIIMAVRDNKAIMYFANSPENTSSIELRTDENGDYFIFKGERKEYKTFSLVNGRDPLTMLKSYQSLVAQARKFTYTSELQKARRGTKCELAFDCPDGYTTDTKDMLDAFKIATTYGYSKKYRSFTNDIKKGEIFLKKDSFHSLNISLLPKAVGGAIATPVVINYYIEKDNFNNLNKQTGITTGVAKQPQGKPKDNIKDALEELKMRKYKATPCGRRASCVSSMNKYLRDLKKKQYETTLREIIAEQETNFIKQDTIFIKEYQEYVNQTGEYAFTYDEWLIYNKGEN